MIGFIPAVLWAAAIFWGSSQSELPTPGLDLPGLDKVAHGCEFAILAALLLYGARRGAFSGWWRWMALATVWGIVDELHQLYVPARFPDAFDVVADATGAAFATAMYRWRYTIGREQ